MNTECVFRIVVGAAACLWQVLSVPLVSAAIKDAESSSHDAGAASYEMVKTYQYPGFKVVQFKLAVLSHYSYVLISGNESLVIDPGRDVFAYLDLVKRERATVKGVFLTHSHADFVAGHIELARATGCPIYTSGSSGAQYPYRPLKEGLTLTVREAQIKFVETPGHTPDGMCAYVYARQKQNTPQFIFTGDTLFVGSVGRPDLIGGATPAAALASMMFDTWTKKLSKVGDTVMILPAHGAGSLCGAHLSDNPSSTIGSEKQSNPYLQYKARDQFIAVVLEDLPEAPQYFKYNAALNKQGPPAVDWNAPLPVETAPSDDVTDPSNYYVVDLRDPTDYASGHIPNSVNIGLRGRFETWVGTMVPWNARLLVTGSETELNEAIYRLHRVGYRAAIMPVENWGKSGLPMARTGSMKPAELYALMQKGEAPLIVDVRLPTEWMAERIGTVVNLPLTHLDELSAKLDPGAPVVTVCDSAYRSSMAVGILERKGFKRLASLAGGSEAWVEAGLPVSGAEVRVAFVPKPPAARITPEGKLAETISASELRRLIIDMPGTFDVVDIRPAADYADFSLPGSRNVAAGDFVTNPTHLAGAGPLIVVDRDGSLAMAVAGALAGQTQREIKALQGGLEAYWEEAELKSAVREIVILGKGTPVSRRQPALAPALPQPRPTAVEQGPAVPQVPSSQAPQPPKRKSAGC